MQHVPDSKEFPETEEEWSQNMDKWTREAEEQWEREGKHRPRTLIGRLRRRIRNFAKPSE